MFVRCFNRCGATNLANSSVVRFHCNTGSNDNWLRVPNKDKN